MSLSLDDRHQNDLKAPAPHAAGGHGYKAVLFFLAMLLAYSALPTLGLGTYRNGSGDRFFELWYMIGFLVIAFFLMHEFITPIPPKKKD